MLPKQTPKRVQRAVSAMDKVMQFMMKYKSWHVTANQEDICDFAMGDPHEMTLPGYVSALEKAVQPQNKDWYAYTVNSESAVETIATALKKQFERPYDNSDIILTNGATGALNVVMHAIVDFGDEVIFNSPPWFFYESMIENVGGVPVRVSIDPATFDLDLAAIEAAITPKTRLIVINSPNNPTGKIYPPETLQALATILTNASEKHGRAIYLMSDEAYRQILFDGNTFYSPTSYYPHSFMVYTYGKTLLTPGQRLGYIAVSPEMPERAEMQMTLLATQLINGLSTANALLQHALPDIQSLSIDMEHMQEKRDRLVSALRDSGYDVHTPDGTFYLLARSPIDDDVAFTDALAEASVFCMPGQVVSMPGYFRISLTGNIDMVERSIPKFAAVRDRFVDA